MSLLEYRYRRWFRVAGYLCWAITGVFKLMPFAIHIAAVPLAHFIAIMLILGGGGAALGNFRGYARLEISGLWLLIGGVTIFAVGVIAENGPQRFPTSMFFVGTGLILAARLLGLYKYELSVGSRWREERDATD